MPHRLDPDISLVLAGLHAPNFHTYPQWEAAFVSRWDMVPNPDVPSLAQKYIEMHHSETKVFTCLEALRIFYVNQFLPRPGEVVAKFVTDFAKLPKQQVEPTWENDPHTGEKLQKQQDLWDPKSARHTGRQVFDMSPDRDRRN